jgi:O-antigen ligase
VLSVLAVLLLPVWLICLYQNLSKTNIPLFFLALLLGSTALALKNPRKLLGTLALVAGLAVFVACTASLALDMIQTIHPKAVKTLENAFLNPTEAKSVDQRGEIWDTAIDFLKDHPLAGLGPGKSLDLLGIHHAHNAPIQLYLDSGLAGFIGLWCVILGVFLRAGELLKAEFLSRETITDERLLPLLSSLAAITYILANMMSDSFSTATIPAFTYFTVLAFSAASEPAPKPAVEASAELPRERRRLPGRRRSRENRGPELAGD